MWNFLLSFSSDIYGKLLCHEISSLMVAGNKIRMAVIALTVALVVSFGADTNIFYILPQEYQGLKEKLL